MAGFFLQPANATQRQYEALRAYFVEGLPSGEVARRFGYSPGSFRVLCHAEAVFCCQLLPPLLGFPRTCILAHSPQILRFATFVVVSRFVALSKLRFVSILYLTLILDTKNLYLLW